MEATKKINGWDRMFQGELESNRYATITTVILIVGCLGGTAVGLGAVANTIMLSAVIIPTMLTLSLVLAVSPMKIILNITMATVLIDLIIITLLFL